MLTSLAIRQTAVHALQLSARLRRWVAMVRAQLPPCFHAVYVRNQDDWAAMCTNFEFMEGADCILPTPIYQKRAVLLLGLRPGDTIFLAGPNHTGMDLWLAMGYHVVTMTTALPWWPTSYGMLGAHDIALVEAAICAEAMSFAGHRLSSFTFLVAEQRALHNKSTWYVDIAIIGYSILAALLRCSKPSRRFVDAPFNDSCQGSNTLCSTLRTLWMNGCRNTEGDLRLCWREAIGLQVNM